MLTFQETYLFGRSMAFRSICDRQLDLYKYTISIYEEKFNRSHGQRSNKTNNQPEHIKVINNIVKTTRKHSR